jgi:hypothetical protein
VNFGGTTGVVLFYGANDGAFRAVRGSDGKELWAFFALRAHTKLKRLTRQFAAPSCTPAMTARPPTREPRTISSTVPRACSRTPTTRKVWLFPTMRRGGRMVYRPSTVSRGRRRCSSGGRAAQPRSHRHRELQHRFTAMGQSWSVPSVALIKGYATGPSTTRSSSWAGATTAARTRMRRRTPSAAPRKGNAVYVLNANTGA